MQLSVIILNYNVKHFLETCIKSVQKALQNIEGEIIVVDNASTDGSKEVMEHLFPEIRYFYQTVNSGFPKGNNIGVNSAKGTFICILNPDTIVSEDSFEILLRQYELLDNPGILGPHLVDGTGNFLPESKRGIPKPWVAFTKVFSLHKLFPNSILFNQYYAQHIKENEIGKTDILVGAFMLMRREIYLKVGGFDEGCFMYSDDIDLSYLILKEKKNNYYVPTTSIIHFKGESTLKDGLYMKRFKEAMQFFYKKHFKTSYFFDAMMKAGIYLFAFKKKSENAKKDIQPDYYILVSHNADLYQKLKYLLHKPIDCVHYLQDIEILNKSSKNIEILIDNDAVSFKEYITFIQKNSNSNKTFKIKPEKADFFLGSNDKNNKGSILSF